MKDYGRFDAPPVKDGSITDPDIMRARLQAVINASIKRSLTLDFIAKSLPQCSSEWQILLK